MLEYLLDTYAWIEYFIASDKGKIVRSIIDDPNSSLITLESSIAELREWASKEDRDFNELLKVIRSRSELLLIRLEDWITATDIKIEQRKRMKDFGLIDALLLAKQRNLKCKIVTGDLHFQGLANVVFL
jgi:predicted nucleic acid-binding protein